MLSRAFKDGLSSLLGLLVMFISGNFGDANISLFTVVTGVGDKLGSKDWTGVCGESGIKCRRFLRITALGACTIYSLGVSVSCNTTPDFLSVVTCTSVPEAIGGSGRARCREL